MTRATPRGTCFGFEAISTVQLRLTRSGSGVPLRIGTHDERRPTPEERLVVEWKPRPDHPFHGKVYADEEGRLRIWTNDAGWFLVDRERPEIALPAGGDRLQAEVRLWSTPMILLLISRGGLVLHASAVEIDGRAVLFGGPSRFGKTTLAAAFHAAGHRVLAEDTSYVVATDGGFSVLPGPALLRVRHDMVTALGLDDLEVLGSDEQRLFLAPRPAMRGTSDPVPMEGLYLLRRDDERVRVEEVGGASAVLPDLWALAFKLPNDEDFRRCLDGLVELGESGLIRNLRRPMNLTRLQETVAAVVEAVA